MPDERTTGAGADPAAEEPPIAEPQSDDRYYRENAHFNTYQSRPIPWWIIAVWIIYVIWGSWYFITNVIRSG